MNVIFSPTVRTVLKAAEEEAKRQLINYVSTEHLLLGLLWSAPNTPKNIPVCALTKLGVAPDQLRSRLLQSMGEPGNMYDPRKSIQLTGNAKRALELAAEEAALSQAPSV